MKFPNLIEPKNLYVYRHIDPHVQKTQQNNFCHSQVIYQSILTF